MTVFPGFGGQSFIGDVMGKVKEARREVDANDLALDIEVDGGIDVTTAPIAVRGGRQRAGRRFGHLPQCRSARRGARASRRREDRVAREVLQHRADDHGHRAPATRRATSSPPNPWVGALVVSERGVVLSEGHTQVPGESHAEIEALAPRR